MCNVNLLNDAMMLESPTAPLNSYTAVTLSISDHDTTFITLET